MAKLKIHWPYVSAGSVFGFLLISAAQKIEAAGIIADLITYASFVAIAFAFYKHVQHESYPLMFERAFSCVLGYSIVVIVITKLVRFG